MAPQVQARRLLNLFQFPAARWNDRVGRLSGGEKRRLQLLKVLATNPNFLVLDEVKEWVTFRVGNPRICCWRWRIWQWCDEQETAPVSCSGWNLFSVLARWRDDAEEAGGEAAGSFAVANFVRFFAHTSLGRFVAARSSPSVSLLACRPAHQRLGHPVAADSGRLPPERLQGVPRDRLARQVIRWFPFSRRVSAVSSWV